ncbi:hypothetical protein KEM60_02336 [Austwickia sp. TVS 96-490-7B]|nr:hypothetical protein [Austwickia sp. TVS 96-490-7B]
MAAPTTIPSASPETFDVIANMPSAAKVKSDEGAVAFTKYFFEAAAQVLMKPSPGEILKLCEKDLKSCAVRDGGAREALSKKWHLSGPDVTLIEASIIDSKPIDNASIVSIALQGTEAYKASIEGRKLADFAEPVVFSFTVYLKYKRTGWLIQRIERPLGGGNSTRGH